MQGLSTQPGDGETVVGSGARCSASQSRELRTVEGPRLKSKVRCLMRAPGIDLWPPPADQGDTRTPSRVHVDRQAGRQMAGQRGQMSIHEAELRTEWSPLALSCWPTLGGQGCWETASFHREREAACSDTCVHVCVCVLLAGRDRRLSSSHHPNQQMNK